MYLSARCTPSRLSYFFGSHASMFGTLKCTSVTMSDDSVCHLMFDEMSHGENLCVNQKIACI